MKKFILMSSLAVIATIGLQLMSIQSADARHHRNYGCGRNNYGWGGNGRHCGRQLGYGYGNGHGHAYGHRHRRWF